MNIIIIIIIIIITVIVYVYVSCMFTDLVEKRIRFPQGLSLVLWLYLRIFYFCIVELWILVNLKYRKNNNNNKKIIKESLIFSSGQESLFEKVEKNIFLNFSVLILMLTLKSIKMRETVLNSLKTSFKHFHSTHN